MAMDWCAVRRKIFQLYQSPKASRLERLPMTQKELAELPGIARPRLNRLLKRKVELFWLQALAMLAVRAGIAMRVGVSRR
jgi:predicted XRE-type DNA-binding protein